MDRVHPASNDLVALCYISPCLIRSKTLSPTLVASKQTRNLGFDLIKMSEFTRINKYNFIKMTKLAGVVS